MNINYIKVISKSGRYYIFDAISNNIYELEKEDFELINDLKDLGYKSTLRENVLNMEGMHNNAINNAKTLIIELTEECNIRCTYCVFDDAYDSERNHGNKYISEDMAIQEINKFYTRTNGTEAYLVFYGGEPLLNFKLIKNLVSYADDLSKNKFKYSFTTNAVSLSSDKFDFLVEHNFKITISIDGPKNVHDSRRLSKNGKGTFDIVLKNLNKFREFNFEYFYKNVDFNCTISNTDEIDEINNFFISNDLFKKEKVRFSPIIQKSIQLDKEISSSISEDEFISSLKSRKPILFKSDDNIGIVQESFLGDIVKKIRYRLLDEKAMERKKICIPFANRTYVRVDGSIQFCERIQNYNPVTSQENLVIQSKKIYDQFYLMKSKSCEACFAYNFCEMCPASFIEEGRFSQKFAIDKCNEFRLNVEKAMNIYINSME